MGGQVGHRIGGQVGQSDTRSGQMWRPDWCRMSRRISWAVLIQDRPASGVLGLATGLVAGGGSALPDGAGSASPVPFLATSP